MIVEVCVDLPTRLQLGSFRAFATSEQVEDAWVLLSAGQSPELAMLTQMLATAQASQPPPNTAARVASKKLCKIPAPKRAKSGRNSGTLSCHIQSLALPVLLAASVPSGLDSVLQSWPRFLVLLPKQPILNPLVNIYIKHGHLGMCYMRHASKKLPQQRRWRMVRIQAHTRVDLHHSSPSSQASLLHCV